MKAILAEQLETLIRTHAPTPPPGEEERLETLLRRARETDILLDLAIVTLMLQKINPPKAFRILVKLGVPKKAIYKVLDEIDVRINRLESIVLITCLVKGGSQHGRN